MSAVVDGSRGGRSARGLALALALIAAPGCRSCQHADEAGPQVVEETAVPAPADLVADVIVASPNTSWTKLQRGIGGTIGLLPPSFASAAVLALGLDPVLASEIDATTPGFGALAGDPASPSWAFAVRASDPRHARAVLAGGDTARYETREVEGLLELVPKAPDGGARPAPVLGLTKGGFVVLASSSAALAALGPYVSRTLAKRPLPAASALVVDVARETIRAVLAPRAEAAWAEQKKTLLASDEAMRRAHGGREPDFGDPKAIVDALDRTLGDRIALLGDVDHARLSVEIGDDDVRAAMTLTPGREPGPASKWVTDMVGGDVSSVLAMPSSAVIAGAIRGAAIEDAGADPAALVLGAFGGRLKGEGDKRVRDAVSDWSRARGDALAFAASWDPPRGLFVRAAVRDREAAMRAMRATVDVAAAPPLDEMLRVKSVRVSGEDVAPVGKVTLATFVRAPDPGTMRPRARRHGEAGAPEAPTSTVGVAWGLEGEAFVVAAGAEPIVSLRTMAKPEKRLADEPAVVRALAAADAIETALVVQPFKLDERRAPLPSAPVAVTLGRQGGDAVLRISAAHALLREVGRLQVTP